MSKLGRFTSSEGLARFDRVYDEGLRTLRPPADVYDLTTDFGRVRAYRFGDAAGRPIVLLPGRGGTTVMWQPNIPELAAQRRVYAIDLLGDAGRSVQTAPIRDANDQAAWLGSVLEQLEIDVAHLVGMSIGGWMACNQAVRASERVASISLLDPANTFGRIPVGAVLRTVPTLLPVVREWALPRFLSWVDGQGGSAPDDNPVGRVISAAMREYRTALPAPALFTDAELRSISVPALAVIAGRSVMHDPQRALDRARGLIPGVEAELWPEATHAISGQFAREVDARVLRFVANVDEESGTGPAL